MRGATCISVNNTVKNVITERPSPASKTKSRNEAMAELLAAEAKRLSAEYDRLALIPQTDAATPATSASTTRTTKKAKVITHAKPAAKEAAAAKDTGAAKDAAPKEALPSSRVIHDILGHVKIPPLGASSPAFFSPSTTFNPNLQMNASTNFAAQSLPRRSVRITGCELVVGYMQTGVLVVDTHRVHISDNRLSAAPLAASDVSRLTSDPAYLARLGRTTSSATSTSTARCPSKAPRCRRSAR